MTRYNQVSQKICILVLLFDRAIVWCIRLVIFQFGNRPKAILLFQLKIKKKTAISVLDV